MVKINDNRIAITKTSKYESIKKCLVSSNTKKGFLIHNNKGNKNVMPKIKKAIKILLLVYLNLITSYR